LVVVIETTATSSALMGEALQQRALLARGTLRRVSKLAWLSPLLVALLACGGASKADAGVDAADDASGDDDADADPIPTLTNARCPAPTSACGAGFWADFDPSYVPLRGDLPLEDRAYYVLTVLAKDATLRADLDADATLSAIATQRDQAIRDASASCATVDCIVAAATWSSAEASAAADALVGALTSSGHLHALAVHLEASGVANVHLPPRDCMQHPDAETSLVRAAWSDAISTTSAGLASYASTAPIADVKSRLSTLLSAHGPTLAPFEPALFALWAELAAQGRDESVRYEPLDRGENAAALAAIPSIDFSKWPFPAIVVPGLGPTDLSTPLSAGGRDRCDLAFARWQAKLAPLVVTSGGHVHPARTPYSEAIEMKKYLLGKGMPASALLVDPYARHTTTNLRNAARLAAHYGIPGDRAWLLTTDWGQTLYVNDPSFGKRCDTELGYRPYALVSQLSNFDSCLWPSATSLQQDARDLLDP
jgi:hypothetical protein